jgi:hypothetical protein
MSVVLGKLVLMSDEDQPESSDAEVHLPASSPTPSPALNETIAEVAARIAALQRPAIDRVAAQVLKTNARLLSSELDSGLKGAGFRSPSPPHPTAGYESKLFQAHKSGFNPKTLGPSAGAQTVELLREHGKVLREQAETQQATVAALQNMQAGMLSMATSLQTLVEGAERTEAAHRAALRAEQEKREREHKAALIGAVGTLGSFAFSLGHGRAAWGLMGFAISVAVAWLWLRQDRLRAWISSRLF